MTWLGSETSMRIFSCNYDSSVPNQALFHQSGEIQNPFTSANGPFKRLYLCMADMHKKPTLVTWTYSSYQKPSAIIRCKKGKNATISLNSEHIYDDASGFDKSNNMQDDFQRTQEKNFWGAVGLILGTAVGPGMLGLPAATIRSGPLPSTISILFSWIYVISSIILVAELSFAVMEEDGVAEVSFTGLARKTLGYHLGSFVALVYASLSFSLLVACVSGIGAIVSQWFPWLHPIIANALFPSLIGTILWLFPFKAIDAANRFLCVLMLFSITALVAIGLLVGRTNISGSFGNASWGISSVLPAIPVAVLTLGFHVITPFVCKIAGNTVQEARKAILLGGFIPLLMVLMWNLIVLGLAGTATASSKDPISLLLSVNSSALAAVQGFAFSALATSLIGYAVSFPKQVIDTLELIFGKLNSRQQHSSLENEAGKVGLLTFTYRPDLGKAGAISFNGLSYFTASEVVWAPVMNSLRNCTMPFVLGLPIVIACLFSSSFSRALDFAGIYANCFLFGILPPLMMHIYQRQKKLRLSIIPGGDVSLLLLFSIAVVLAIWH